ncbi:hypothetical protein Fot_51049 [Forsythia ovata]|uniref:Mediator of RNA polymerase II transcription subunit 1 n=1 Tax=Forsythia ovata TaxID=205694 RepID=A0ABD1PUA9_9LAMI
MERSEPALVPEWLRCTGSIVGGASIHNSDVSSSTHTLRNKSSRSSNDKDSSRFLDRTSSSNFKGSSISNGSVKHPYSSFTRSNRDKTREREKDRSLIGDISEYDDHFDRVGNIITSRVEKSTLWRSQSSVSRKSGDVLLPRVENLKTSAANQNSGFGGSNIRGIQNAAFEKDFPALATEDKQAVTGFRGVASHGLSSSVQNLPICNSGLLGGEKWTSALAEVPAILATNGMGQSAVQQSSIMISTPASAVSTSAGLNMAEALSQAPARVRAATQLPDKSQRLEELAIKQSRQLIPMTPSTPKPLAPNSADKLKQSKTAARTNDMIVPSKGVHQQSHSSQLSIQSRVGQVRSDAPNISHAGKFLVLKPGRENSVTSVVKDASSPTGNANCRLANSQATAPLTPTASMSSNNAIVSALESKVAVDKRSSQTPSQSRSNFFNLMRKKTSSSPSAILSDSSSAVSSPNTDTSGEIFKEGNAPVSSRVMEKANDTSCNSDAHDTPEKTQKISDAGENTCANAAIYPDEEEAAFLRSLGWEENGGEDEGLTEEEINTFYQEYMNRRSAQMLNADV